MNNIIDFMGGLWTEKLLPFFLGLGNALRGFFKSILSSAEQMTKQSVFWQYALPAVGILLLLVIAASIILSVHKRRERRRVLKKKGSLKSIEEQRAEANREDLYQARPLAGIGVHELLMKLLTAEDWNEDLKALCRAEGPALIFTLASAWLRIPPAVKQGLAELAREDRWTRQYIARMDNFRYTADYALLLWQLAPDSDCLPMLADLLGAKEQRVHLAAVELIGKLKDQRLIPYLVGNLLQPEHFVTARVGEALLSFGGEAASVCAEMLPQCEAKQAILLLEVLSLFRCDYPADNVIAALDSPLEQVRAKAAKTLGEGRRREAADKLNQALNDSSPQVRAAAVIALGQLGARGSLPLIEQLQEDENWSVRVNSQKVAEQLKRK